MPALLRGAAVSCWWWLLVKDFKQRSGMTSFVMVQPFSVDCVFLGYLLLYLSSLEGRYWVWLTCVCLAWPFTGLWRSSVLATPGVTPPQETNSHSYLLGRGLGFSLKALWQADGREILRQDLVGGPQLIQRGCVAQRLKARALKSNGQVSNTGSTTF